MKQPKPRSNQGKEKNAKFEKQYLKGGGFCGACGEAVEPILGEDNKLLGKCHCTSQPLTNKKMERKEWERDEYRICSKCGFAVGSKEHQAAHQEDQPLTNQGKCKITSGYHDHVEGGNCGLSCHEAGLKLQAPQPLKKQWETQFDEIMPECNLPPYGVARNKLKKFIQSLLDQQREELDKRHIIEVAMIKSSQAQRETVIKAELIEKIEGMKRCTAGLDFLPKGMQIDMTSYNQALDNVIASLKTKEDK